MMKEYKGHVTDVYRPAPKSMRDSRGRTATRPRPAKVSVRLDNGHALPGLPEPAGLHLVRGDRITLHADLTRGTIGPIQNDYN